MSDIERIIERYKKGSELFAQALEGVPQEILDRAPAPGKWSIRQIAIHLADAEIVGAMRLRSIAAQPGSLLKAYDQDAWAQKLAYERLSPELALELFRGLRASTAAMLRVLPAAAWENTAQHEESGMVRLGEFVEHYSKHAEHHSAQIRELRLRWGSAATA